MINAPARRSHDSGLTSVRLCTPTPFLSPARLLHLAFMYLPSAVDYPDYYAVIGNKALAFDQIRAKMDKCKRTNSQQLDWRSLSSSTAVSTDEYRSLSQVKSDFAQVFDNAKNYNMKGSQIYLDAKKLKVNRASATKGS